MIKGTYITSGLESPHRSCQNSGKALSGVTLSSVALRSAGIEDSPS